MRHTKMLVAGAAILALTGCGGGDTTDSGAANPESVTEASARDHTSVEYDGSLRVTLQSVEDNTRAIADYSADLGGWHGEGSDMAVRVTWLVENIGDEAIPVDIPPNSMAMTSCFETEDRTAAEGLYGEEGLFFTETRSIPTLMNAGTSFEYFDTCILDPGATPWTLIMMPYSFGEGEHGRFTFTEADTLLPSGG
ncbi:hypothetical protein [Serinicoccus sp. LYQ131]|uniref:hypothetical protein n=1 Tax=Serinicoccus sp. LYQ131 TaxID=3378797 RepID=UPI0038541B07